MAILKFVDSGFVDYTYDTVSDEVLSTKKTKVPVALKWQVKNGVEYVTLRGYGYRPRKCSKAQIVSMLTRDFATDSRPIKPQTVTPHNGIDDFILYSQEFAFAQYFTSDVTLSEAVTEVLTNELPDATVNDLMLFDVRAQKAFSIKCSTKYELMR